jgi:hypothetical protein
MVSKRKVEKEVLDFDKDSHSVSSREKAKMQDDRVDGFE